MGFKVKLKASPPLPIYKDEESDFLSNNDHYKQVLHYQKRLKECGPFDIDCSIDVPCYIGELHPCHYPNYERERAALDKCVLHSIAFARKEKRMDLVDQKVVYAKHQGDCGVMYYITFEAKDKRSGKRQLYNARFCME